MKLREITYFIEGKKRKIKVKVCKSFFSKARGLMFRRHSPPLLFVFNKNGNLRIHSFFCKPFRAVWLDEKMRATKIIDVRNLRLDISGRGKYLLEIPGLLLNDESSTIKRLPAIETFK